MKHVVSVITVAAVVALVACTDPAKDAPKATVSDAPAPAATAPAAAPAGALAFTQEGSTIAWTGSKVTGKHDGAFKTFHGTIDPTTQSVMVDIDTASLFTEPEKLVTHLKSADFFDVAKFPTAHFQSTSVKDGKVEGDLTLHGVTKHVSFPATITTSPDAASAKAEFAINRKDFGLVYPGKPDDLIRDDVVIKLDINAKKGA